MFLPFKHMTQILTISALHLCYLKEKIFQAQWAGALKFWVLYLPTKICWLSWR